jgi:IS30 family transposase
VRDAIAGMITTLPEQLRRSLTWDQGAEMAQHAQLQIDTGLQVYSYGGEPRQASTACCLHRGLP